MYAAVLFAVGLLLWGQGNLWNADYGVLAGQDLDLSAQRMARAIRARRLGGRATGRARVFSADQPYRAVCVAGVPGSSDSRRGRCEPARESAAAQRVRWVEPPAAIYQFSVDTKRHPHRARRIPVGCVRRHFSAGSRRRSIASSADSSILPTTPARSRRRRSACRRCSRGRSTGTRNRRRSSFERRSSSRRCSRKCRRPDTTSTRCRSCRPIHSSSGWVRKQRRTGRARVSGSANRSSAAKTIARSPRASCSSCRSSATCRTRRRPSASSGQTRSIGRSGWIEPNRRRRFGGTRPAIRWRSSSSSST